VAPIVLVLRPRAPERAFGASNTSRPRPDGRPATRVACRSIVPMIAVGFLLIVVGFSLIAVRSGDPESRSSRSVSIGRQWSSAYDARSGLRRHAVAAKSADPSSRRSGDDCRRFCHHRHVVSGVIDRDRRVDHRRRQRPENCWRPCNHEVLTAHICVVRRSPGYPIPLASESPRPRHKCRYGTHNNGAERRPDWPHEGRSDRRICAPLGASHIRRPKDARPASQTAGTMTRHPRLRRSR
jgi:hypothetical protein